MISSVPFKKPAGKYLLFFQKCHLFLRAGRERGLSEKHVEQRWGRVKMVRKRPRGLCTVPNEMRREALFNNPYLQELFLEQIQKSIEH